MDKGINLYPGIASVHSRLTICQDSLTAVGTHTGMAAVILAISLYYYSDNFVLRVFDLPVIL